MLGFCVFINLASLGIHKLTEESRDIAKEQLQIHKDQAKERLSKEEQEIHQLFRLSSSNDATYEWYKDQIEERVEGTCMWLLQHKHFPKWLKQDESGPLLITADPGCGKSVLAKYLIDHGLPQSATNISCDAFELTHLIRNLESQFHSHQPSKLKLLLTCRPYKQIISKFHGLSMNFPNIHIPGEEESAIISQEVESVIGHWINRLPLSPEIRNCLEERLREIPHRTYLWVYLIFDHIQRGDFKQTLKGAESLIQTLPRNVNETYERIFNRSKGEQEPVVRKALGIILAASRPLTLTEMNVAMSIDDSVADNTAYTVHSLDLEDENDFKSRLRSWCGLFISIYQSRVYLLHQTAREFLLTNSASPTLL